MALLSGLIWANMPVSGVSGLICLGEVTNMFPNDKNNLKITQTS